MKTSYKPIVLDAEPDETTLIVAEIDNLIATAEARIECQREYVRSVGSDFEGSASMRVAMRSSCARVSMCSPNLSPAECNILLPIRLPSSAASG